MTDPTETAAPVTTDRAFSTADLAYINRMTTTGMVLPSVAHEVNNSLQVIAGMVEILGLRGQLPPEVSDKVQKIAVQATIDPTMPIARSRSGFFASSAAVEIASKP